MNTLSLFKGLTAATMLVLTAGASWAQGPGPDGPAGPHPGWQRPPFGQAQPMGPQGQRFGRQHMQPGPGAPTSKPALENKPAAKGQKLQQLLDKHPQILERLKQQGYQGGNDPQQLKAFLKQNPQIREKIKQLIYSRKGQGALAGKGMKMRGGRANMGPRQQFGPRRQYGQLGQQRQRPFGPQAGMRGRAFMGRPNAMPMGRMNRFGRMGEAGPLGPRWTQRYQNFPMHPWLALRQRMFGQHFLGRGEFQANGPVRNWMKQHMRQRFQQGPQSQPNLGPQHGPGPRPFQSQGGMNKPQGPQGHGAQGPDGNRPRGPRARI